MIPRWKLTRELSRLGLQVGQIPWFLTSGLLRHRYDRARAGQVRVDRGSVPLSPQVGLLLLYQTGGLAPSVHETLAHFRRHGLAPVAVSNAPLREADLSALRDGCALVIQRPNLGYDFGGYREGVMTLMDQGPPLEHLVILNDSVWFPIYPDCTFLGDALDAPSDLYGLFLNRRPDAPHRDHLQSYFYRFGPRLLRSPEFSAYWRDLFLTNNKWQVVRQNEMKLTDRFRRAGFRIGSRFDGPDILAALDALPDAERRQVAAYYRQLGVAARRPPGSGEPASAGLSAKDRARVSGYLLNGHPHVLLGRLQVPMLKKDRQPIYALQRRELLSAGYDRHLADAVRREVTAMAS